MRSFITISLFFIAVNLGAQLQYKPSDHGVFIIPTFSAGYSMNQSIYTATHHDKRLRQAVLPEFYLGVTVFDGRWLLGLKYGVVMKTPVMEIGWCPGWRLKKKK